MTRTKNMTSGNPVKLILVFALPILAGNMLQQLYSLVDSLIIGRILGVTALTAVSASGWLDWAVLSIPMGLAQGYSIHAAQCYGGKRFADLKRGVLSEDGREAWRRAILSPPQQRSSWRSRVSSCCILFWSG